ncbi:MAG: TerB family tellurite resistance protein [Polyangiaceae bacterium]|nr:TerB family tellurite resistance protein [Polyangiaceae bacterium]
MLSKLSKTDRMRLMRFVCSFAWADLEVQNEERAYVHRMVRKLKLDDSERKQVEEWLTVPPLPEQVDPNSVPREHRLLFLEAVRGVVSADRVLDPEEQESLALFEQLLV